MKNLLFLLSFTLTLIADVQIEALKTSVATTLPTIEGWCSQEKAKHFIDLVMEVKPETCVDIGAFGGSSVFPVASALKLLEHGTVIAIDPWDKIECIKYYDPVEDAVHLQWWGKLNLNYVYYSYLNMIRKNKLETQIQTIKDTSEKAAAQITGPIDIIHIDGNHSEEASLLDVQLYLPKVKQGGYIWFNDCLSAERQKALDLLIASCETVKIIDGGNCILFKKK